MEFISTKDAQEKVSFAQAALKGLADNEGLYMPSNIPVLAPSFFDKIGQLSSTEIGVKVLTPFLADSFTENQLETIVSETLSFPIPLKKIQAQISALELFHGPTMAFKDVGARFMSRCLSLFSIDNEVTVLAATSGDTGSAVANGFYKVPGVQVKILFPKGKVSPFQEYQMTSLGHNIEAIEVDGSFDDCQALVKKAFQDENIKRNLSSANSINVARLMPQMLYYFLAYKEIRKTTYKNIVVSVPSGNFGNITAGIIAKKMGLPIHRFVAACNANDAFYDYIQSGVFQSKSTIATYANAMDVGAPNNFPRLLHIYNNDHAALCKDISAYTYNDDQILSEMKECHLNNQYTLCPHGAIGKLALGQSLTSEERRNILSDCTSTKI